jgi:hypothetical protein
MLYKFCSIDFFLSGQNMTHGGPSIVPYQFQEFSLEHVNYGYTFHREYQWIELNGWLELQPFLNHFFNWINDAALFGWLNNRESDCKNVHPRSVSTPSPDAQETSVLTTTLRRTRGRPWRTIGTSLELSGAAKRQNFIRILLTSHQRSSHDRLKELCYFVSGKFLSHRSQTFHPSFLFKGLMRSERGIQKKRKRLTNEPKLPSLMAENQNLTSRTARCREITEPNPELPSLAETLSERRAPPCWMTSKVS